LVKEIKEPVLLKLNNTHDDIDKRFYNYDKKTQRILNTMREEVQTVNKECLAYTDHLNTFMMKNFEIPGLVNNRDFQTDEEAAGKN
jgi:hypothetical protein